MCTKEKQENSDKTENPNPSASPVCYMNQFPDYFGFSETEQKDHKKPTSGSLSKVLF